MTISEASILVVDDEPILRLTFSVLLKKAGATVHTASDGVEALDLLSREPVDIMLTDKQMPNMDGMTLLRNLRDRGDAYPSLLFVNGIEPLSQAELDSLHIVDTVSKPLHPRDLLAIFERALAPLSKRA